MANTDLAVRIATILDASGLKKADKAVSKFEKSVKGLSRTLGIALSGAAITAYGKASVKAFLDDEKAAAKLTTAVKNLGLSFAQPEIDQYIAKLEQSSAVADDVLRPAFQALLTTTGSLAQSQEILATALEASRGSGIELQTVAQDLANAYVGNTKGLKKYNLGLTQAELKAMSFTDVQKKLNAQFQGSNATYLETTAGKFEAISVAAGNAAESIGGSLVDAIMVVTGSSTVNDLTSGIETITGYVNGLVESVAFDIFSTKALFNPKYWGKGQLGKIQEDFDKLMAARKLAAANPFDAENNAVTGYQRDRAAQIQAEKDAKKRAKELIAAQNKQTAELKKQAALKKAGSIFDLQQIQIIAALKGNISEEERKRLELQLALEQGNVDEAKKLTYELAIAQGLGVKIAQDLASLPEAKNPFGSWKAYLDQIEAQARRIAMFNGGGSSTARGESFATLTPTVQSLVAGGGGSAGSTSAGDVYITVNGSVLSEQDLVLAVQNGLNYNSLAGKKSDIGRIAGMFG